MAASLRYVSQAKPRRSVQVVQPSEMDMCHPRSQEYGLGWRILPTHLEFSRDLPLETSAGSLADLALSVQLPLRVRAASAT